MTTVELSAPAQAFADGDVALLPSALAPGEGERLVALLSERADAARLQKLGEGSDKALAKLARKALHQLRTKGVAEPAREKRVVTLSGPFAPAEEPSLATVIDGHGERVVWLVRAGDSGFDVYEARLSDVHGLQAFQAVTVPRREWRPHAKRMIAESEAGVAEVSERHARGLIEAGYRRAVAAGRAVPEAFAVSRLSLGHYDAEPNAPHPALALAPPLPLDEARGLLAALHALPEIRRWFPPEEALTALDAAVGAIAASRLIVDPAGRQAQLHEAVGKVADAHLTPAWRARLAERLHESALLAVARGALEEARVMNTAAALTLDETVAPHDNPFLTMLFAKIVRVPESAAAEQAQAQAETLSPSGLILKP